MKPLYDSLLYDVALENAFCQSTWLFIFKVFQKCKANKWKLGVEININGCVTGDWGTTGAIRSGVEENIQESIETARPENAGMIWGQIFH